MRLPAPFFVLPLATLAACSLAPSEDAAAVADVTVHPTGAAAEAILTVTLPVGVVGPGEAGAVLDGTWIPLGVPTRVTPDPDGAGLTAITLHHGTDAVDLPGAAKRWAQYEERYAVPSGSQTTIALGAATFHGSDAWRPDIDMNLTPPDSFGGESVLLAIGDQRSTKYDWRTPLHDAPVPLRAGHYEYDSGTTTMGRRGFDVVENQIVAVDTTGPRFASVRRDRGQVNFPDAPSARVDLRCGEANGPRGRRWLEVGKAAAPYRTTIYATEPVTCSLTYLAGGKMQSAPFVVHPLEETVVTEPRLEVDDVALDDAAGTKVRGTYTVMQWLAGGVLGPILVKDVPTGTGLPLPAALYHVVTTYVTPLGVTRTTTNDVQL